MDTPWGSEISKQFITNLGLITSTGPHGQNIMAAEWTHHISYEPGLVAVCIRPDDATHENIHETGEFGVNIASARQASLSSVAGSYTGRKVDKIGMLKEMGFGFHEAGKIKSPMVSGAALNLECRLVRELSLGDHTMFVGEVVAASVNSAERPMAYHRNMYHGVVQDMPKPSDEERARTEKLAEKHAKTNLSAEKKK